MSIPIFRLKMDLAQLVGKVKEFIYLLETTPDQVQGLGMEELKAFLQEQLRNAYDLKEGQIEQQRPGLMREAERFFILQQIDTLWREHLQAKDALRESVGLRGYGQKDPLIEYKNEGYDMFLEMMTNMRRNDLLDVHVPAPGAPGLLIRAEQPLIDEVQALELQKSQQWDQLFELISSWPEGEVRSWYLGNWYQLAQQQYAKAVEAYTPLLAGTPQRVEVLLQLGRALHGADRAGGSGLLPPGDCCAVVGATLA